MCTTNNLSLTIGAMGTCVFLKSTIGYKILWRFIKMVEKEWGAIFYCWIFGSLDFIWFIVGGQIKAKWIFSIDGIPIKLHRCRLGTQNLNELILISKN